VIGPTTASSAWNTSSIGDEHGQSRIRPNEPRGDQRVPRPGGNAGGVFLGKPLILLHHIGAKSGTERISPLVPLLYDGRIFIFASKGGSDRNPDWYGNLVAQPNVTVELGTETFPTTARTLHGGERYDINAKQTALEPQFGDYERATQRIIPVVELVRKTDYVPSDNPGHVNYALLRNAFRNLAIP
jgi:deazaflavin-dependent oxidoreductase (nitroreductase family)